MYWADDIVQQIKTRYKDKISKKEPIIIRDEKTASGRVHVGSLRGVAIHGLVSELLTEQGINNKYLFEINDFDPMDGIPTYLDQEKYKQYLGMPLNNVPSPDGKAKNFAEYYGQEFVQVIKELGFTPEIYRSSEVYKSGKYNDVIRIALDNAEKIREIYKRVSGSQRDDKWYPVQIICENCGKVSTTKITSWDGKEVSYTCADLEWTNGCNHTGKVAPFDGKAKLPWKVEWPAKFRVFGVDVEGGGKDHSTRGGAREVADAISREVFQTDPPLNIPYEFFNVGGKKMSSSKGAGTSSREMADLLPPHLLRLLLLQRQPQRVIDFIPDGDTVPILFDSYDKLAASYFKGENEDEKRTFAVMHPGSLAEFLKSRFLPRFSQIAYMVQMPHIDVVKEVEKEKGQALTDFDIKEINLRKEYAKKWLDTYAPEDYKFDLKQQVPEPAKNLSSEQKQALKQILEYVQSKDKLDGQELHTKLHEIRKSLTIEPKAYFEALYLSFLGKESGPKAGWFFSVLDKKFVEKRLDEITKS
ncbi:lysine--tRNA ligase [Candidatus Parcubacteria bacterium]|nr:lysine--tRNA ligase [Candidatus Parcubacteria bacterium]